jgi:nicotinamidase/pyrazinamidase
MRALLIVDVQVDFCEGGALGVSGGTAVAEGITRFLGEHSGDYAVIIASRDWHDADSDNGGHFALVGAPNFVDTWPIHCVAGTPGADYHPALDTQSITHHVKKGQGIPAYSMFEGSTEDGQTVETVLQHAGVDGVDVVGIATDYCVRATALDALGADFTVSLLTDLTAAVSPEHGLVVLGELSSAGVDLR